MWRPFLFKIRDCLVVVAITMLALDDDLGAFAMVIAPAAVIAAIMVTIHQHDLAVAAAFSPVTVMIIELPKRAPHVPGQPAFEAARFAKGKAKGEIIEIVERSTGTKLIMLEDGRTG
jgi:hypothetical protein